MRAEDALKILKNITDKDAKRMGFDVRFTRPENFIIQVLLLAPPHVRPSIEHKGRRSADDLT